MNYFLRLNIQHFFYCSISHNYSELVEPEVMRPKALAA